MHVYIERNGAKIPLHHDAPGTVVTLASEHRAKLPRSDRVSGVVLIHSCGPLGGFVLQSLEAPNNQIGWVKPPGRLRLADGADLVADF